MPKNYFNYYIIYTLLLKSPWAKYTSWRYDIHYDQVCTYHYNIIIIQYTSWRVLRFYCIFCAYVASFTHLFKAFDLCYIFCAFI